MKSKNGIFFNTLLLILFLYNILIIIYSVTSLILHTNPEQASDSGWLIVYTLVIISSLVLLVLCFLLLFRPFHKMRRNYRFLNAQGGYDYELKANPNLPAEINEYISNLHGDLRRRSASYQNREAELLALQTQINPHFLYNTLESIRGDALEAGVENIAKATEALSMFFRYTITNTDTLVTLGDELEHVNNYFIIQQYRFLERLKLSLIFPQEKEAILSLKIPKLILQPIVENAIFHGLECRASGGEICIEITHTEKRLLVNVSDNGVGMPKETLDRINDHMRHDRDQEKQARANKTNGIALNNVSRRIHLLFGLEYGLRLMSVEGEGTQAIFTLPKIRNDEIEIS